MNALDIIALTVPPDGGYGSIGLLEGIRDPDTIPGLLEAVTTDLRGESAQVMASPEVHAEVVAYMHTALGEAALGHFGPRDFSTRAAARCALDVARFMDLYREECARWIEVHHPGSLGRDLWLTRSMTTEGFWSRHWRAKDPMLGIADRLTDAAHRLGPLRLRVDAGVIELEDA